MAYDAEKPPRRRGNTDPGLVTREALIQAAIDQIAEQGVAAATTARIAERAGVSRGSLQHHFRTRDELMLAVAERAALADHVDSIDALAKRPLEERVEHFYDYYERSCLSNNYAAATNLMSALDKDSAIARSVRDILEAAVRANRSTHSRLFWDIDLDGDDMLAMLRTLLAMIDGVHRANANYSDALKNDLPRMRRHQVAMLLAYFGSRRRARARRAA